MRSLIHNALTNEAELTALVPAERWVARSALDDRPETPFVVLAMGAVTPALASVRRGGLSVWVHDDRGSYVRIDSILDIVEKRLLSYVHRTFGDAELMVVEFEGRSDDLEDDGLRTATRNSSFRIVGKNL
jgi:hypothetical protein